MNKRDTVTFAVRFAIEADKAPIADKASSIPDDCLAILRLAGQHKRACEGACSVPPPDSDPRQWERLIECAEALIVERLKPYGIGAKFQRDPRQWERLIECAEASIVERLEPYGIGAKFQRDPRGATVRLLLPSGYSDHPEGGYCVPASGFSAAQLGRMGR